MKRILVGLVLLGLMLGTVHAQAAYRVGVGVNYWTALDSIKIDDVDDDGFSYLISYQYRPGPLGLQLDFEFLPDRFGEDAYAPAAYVVLGGFIYAAAGIGIIHQDGDWADDPFIALKAGLDLELLPQIYFDISAGNRSKRGVTTFKVSNPLIAASAPRSCNKRVRAGRRRVSAG